MFYFFRIIYVFNKIMLKIEFLRLHHDDFLTKHFDTKKIRNFINQKYFWFWIIVDVNEYIKNCNVCQRIKTFKYRFYNKLQSLFVFTRFWKKIIINFIIELFFNRYENNVYNVIFVVICRLFKITFYIHNNLFKRQKI